MMAPSWRWPAACRWCHAASAGPTGGHCASMYSFPIGRLDYMFAVTQVTDMVRSCETLRHASGSDHLPLLMTLRYS